MISRILIGLFMVAVGYTMVAKTEWYMEMLGALPWAQQHLGQGGTRLLYKLIGIVIIFLGLLVTTNLFDLVVGGFIRSLFG